MSYVCPYAQRAWITRNYKVLLIVCGLLELVLIHEYMLYLSGKKNQYMLLNWNVIALGHQGLQEEIKLVPMDMADKPAWYKKVYPKNEVRIDSRYM